MEKRLLYAHKRYEVFDGELEYDVDVDIDDYSGVVIYVDRFDGKKVTDEEDDKISKFILGMA